MKRKIALFLIIFLLAASIAYSMPAFTVKETELVSLAPKAEDPDSNTNLVFTYTAPLNENGEWQTNYGDAGQYKVTITVSDGVTSTSQDALIIVERKEVAPEIQSFIPKEDSLSIKESESMDFSVLAIDKNNDELSYEWLLDGKAASTSKEFTYTTTYNDQGSHEVSVSVSDGIEKTEKKWNVNVENVNVDQLLDGIEDITINENNIASLKLPDFESYGLAYTISEPIGNDNEWQTGYEDSGTYEASVHAEGKGFKGDKKVKVTVNDVDRSAIFQKIDNIEVQEGQGIKTMLDAYDPDGDRVTYSASNLPEGAELNDNIFAWIPNFDIVKKQGFLNSLLSRFKTLDKKFTIEFATTSKEKKITQNVVITVKDANRPPIIDDIAPITIKEGETLKINANAYDPDGGRLKITYSGLGNSGTYKSQYGDAGQYKVKVTASDGKLEASKEADVTIEKVNRLPIFSKIKNIKAKEGDEIAILLDAYNPNNDNVSYSIDNPPEGSSLNGNSFLWTPGFGVAGKNEKKNFDLVFVASDGQSEARNIVKLQVADKNRVPKIINATKSLIVKVNQPVLMSVKAIDDDNDELTYTWKFGLLESYKATPNHQRIFTAKGTKNIKVIVSDGTGSVEQPIIVNVI